MCVFYKGPRMRAMKRGPGVCYKGIYDGTHEMMQWTSSAAQCPGGIVDERGLVVCV
jgi:hypothetical protein